MSELDSLKASEKLGQAAESFINSDLGRFLNGAFLQDVEQAKSELLELDPWKFKDLISLQNALMQIQQKVKTAESIQSYLSEAINEGRDATHQLENEI